MLRSLSKEDLTIQTLKQALTETLFEAIIVVADSYLPLQNFKLSIGKSIRIVIEAMTLE